MNPLGKSTQFTNTLEPDARSRAVFTFHRPEELIRLVKREKQVRTLPLRGSEVGYFDPSAPIANLDGNLPHFRQDGATYFVTFRAADSLPQNKLKQWIAEREEWLKRNPEPHTPDARREYSRLFLERIQHWLDAGYGKCLLSRPEVRQIVVDALNHFEADRYSLREWVVHIASSLNIEEEDLEEVPFNQIGGMGRAYELFGDQIGILLAEMNQRLAA